MTERLHILNKIAVRWRGRALYAPQQVERGWPLATLAGALPGRYLGKGLPGQCWGAPSRARFPSPRSLLKQAAGVGARWSAACAAKRTTPREPAGCPPALPGQAQRCQERQQAPGRAWTSVLARV